MKPVWAYSLDRLGRDSDYLQDMMMRDLPRRKSGTRRMLICGSCSAEFMPSRSDAKWCFRLSPSTARANARLVVHDVRVPLAVC